MLVGETILSGASPSCCGKRLAFRVLRSAAGYYIGTACPNHGPYSRETGYFPTEADAQRELDNGPAWRDSAFNPDGLTVTEL